jgi:hypothetical protein
MAVERQMPASQAVERPARAVASPLRGGGTAGNEQLTAATGAALIVLLAVIGVTIVWLRPLLSIHLFVGMLLIGPALLKLLSTGYRFARYYTHSRAYVSKGPPPAPLRAIAPIVVITTVIVLGSGVALLFAGPQSRSTLLPIHKISFFVWVAFMALHVLGHLAEMPRALKADYGPAAQPGGEIPGRSGRVLSLAGALVAGAVLAILVIPEFGPWLHSSGVFHHHH